MLQSLGVASHGIPGLLQTSLLAVVQQGLLPSAVGGFGAWTSVRTATKKAGGTAGQSVDSHPKHLGMKMSAGELAFPGMILVRQRGTKFHPGPNVGLGRDHTLFSTGVGIVRVSVSQGPAGKERRYVSVEPLPEAVAAANSDAITAAAGPGATLTARQRLVEADLVKRRGQVKRAMLKGSVPLEPALYFNLPTQPNGRFSWLERPEPKAESAQQKVSK